MIQDPVLATFCETFNKLDKSCTKKLYSIYANDIVFIDPLHRVEGIEALERDFEALYANVIDCHFDFHHGTRDGDRGYVAWTMILRHRRLCGGRQFEVEGCSTLRFASSDGGKVIHHQDHFDAGALLYERLPLLGALIRRIKRQAAS